MRILVTGGSGFIGSHLVERLVADGHNVRVLQQRDASPKHGFLADLGVETVHGDIRAGDDVDRAVRDCELVYHLAAKVSGADIAPRDFHEINALGTLNVTRAAARSGVAGLVAASSVSVYGVQRSHSITEQTPVAPRTPYARSKVYGEEVVRAEHKRSGLRGVNVRLTSVFGARSTSWIPLLRTLRDGSFALLGTGANSVHPAGVGDIVHGLVAAGERGGGGETYILAGPEPLSLRRMLELMSAAVGANGFPEGFGPKPLRLYGRLHDILPTPLGDRLPRYDRVEFFLNDRAYDLAAARSALAYEPRVPIARAITELVKSARERGAL
jgi:nucleoside-diphosphate-sugar epimerase